MYFVDFFIFKFQSLVLEERKVLRSSFMFAHSPIYHALRWVNKLKDLTRQSLVQLVQSEDMNEKAINIMKGDLSLGVVCV